MRKLFAVLLLGVTVLALVAPVDAGDRNFVAHLSARDEVPSNESLAQGQAIFDLRADGTQLDYKLIAANIDNVVFAHIHLAPAGVNGPVIAFLFGPVAAGGGRFSGVLAQGTLTEDDLIGPLAGPGIHGPRGCHACGQQLRQRAHRRRSCFRAGPAQGSCPPARSAAKSADAG